MLKYINDVKSIISKNIVIMFFSSSFFFNQKHCASPSMSVIVCLTTLYISALCFYSVSPNVNAKHEMTLNDFRKHNPRPTTDKTNVYKLSSSFKPLTLNRINGKSISWILLFWLHSATNQFKLIVQERRYFQRTFGFIVKRTWRFI